MKTHKERVQEYVRKQISALKELSFGCEVIVSDWDKPVFVSTKQHIDSDGNTYRYVSWGAVSKKLYDKPRETEIKLEKVIGHPIQFHHYLQVLGKACGGTVTLRAGNGCYSTELGINIYFNLTTGQPAAGKDWELLANILGV